MIALQPQETLRIRPWRPTRIECASGVLWVTREGDLRDFIVARGESLEVERGVTIALALEPATVRVVRQPFLSWWSGFGELLRVGLRRQRSSASLGLSPGRPASEGG